MTKVFFFYLTSLLLLNEVCCEWQNTEAQTTPGHFTSSYDLKNSESRERESQECQKKLCSSSDKDSPSGMALVLYNEESIPTHYKPQRQFTFLGHTLTIAQSWGKHGVAGVVWDSAVVLSEYLTAHQEIVRGKRVLELGSGTGLVGMAAALAGGEVTFTERAEPLEHLQAAVNSNLDPSCHHFHVLELDWTQDHSHLPQSSFDVILGADIIYIEETFPDLLRTLLHFMGPQTHVLLSCKIRYEKDSRFLSMLQQQVHLSKVRFDADRDIHIYSAERKEGI
ncbi:protein N-lysine methyltransferase METTL21A-like isoform X2 [Babylonia areolata]